MRIELIAILTGAIICAGAARCDRAQGATLDVRITRGVPVVPGIREGAGPYDAGPLARVDRRPSARVLDVLDTDGAPPNGCATPAFRVVSGPRAQRGCYGSP